MPQFHLCFEPAAGHPYDRQDWQWQMIGHLLQPFVAKFHPARFWFSCYVAPAIPKHLYIRYETDKIAEDKELPLPPKEHYEFDIVGNLSGQRFLGDNKQHNDKSKRGNLIFDFLHQGSLLTLAQLSHLENGYWCIEKNQDVGNNHYGSSLESPHHLFCNLSGVPTAVVVIDPVVANQKQISQLLSPLYSKIHGVYAPNLPVCPVQY